MSETKKKLAEDNPYKIWGKKLFNLNSCDEAFLDIMSGRQRPNNSEPKYFFNDLFKVYDDEKEKQQIKKNLDICILKYLQSLRDCSKAYIKKLSGVVYISDVWKMFNVIENLFYSNIILKYTLNDFIDFYYNWETWLYKIDLKDYGGTAGYGRLLRILEKFRRFMRRVPISGIEENKNVCDGFACIKNTEIPVWKLVRMKKFGLTEDSMLRKYPMISYNDLDNVRKYFRIHKIEIDIQIRIKEGR